MPEKINKPRPPVENQHPGSVRLSSIRKTAIGVRLAWASGYAQKREELARAVRDYIKNCSDDEPRLKAASAAGLPVEDIETLLEERR